MAGVRTVEESATACRTDGLASAIGHEIRVAFATPDLMDAARELLWQAGTYIESGAQVRSGETMCHGFWMLRFSLENGILNTYEIDRDWSGFIEGATRSLEYWRIQQAVCRAAKSTFEPPLASRKVALSEGVLEGEAVEGVRYPAPPHMSGWYLTTERYDGNVDNLRVIHMYHVAEARPDLVRYFGLGPGHFFDYRQSIGFAPDVADEPA